MPRLKTQTDMLGACAAARYLGVSRSTLTSWRRRGVVPAIVVEGPRGSLYKFRMSDLDEFRKEVDYNA
jgi:excisionase family DNA binding protein